MDASMANSRATVGRRLGAGARRLRLAAAALCVAAPAAAEPKVDTPLRVVPACDDARGALSATWENDIFAGTDSDYTNGVRLSYVTPCDNHFLLDRLARNALSRLYPSATRWHGTYAFGQNIYTPEDIEDPNPGPDARPYAGFLYASAGVIADVRSQAPGGVDRLDSFVVDLGVVGPASAAENAQKIVHEIINDRDPVGWDDQIENEPGFRVMLERKWRFGRDRPMPWVPVEIDALPHLGVALGNVDTSAAAGGLLRIGRSLQHDYGPPRVRPGLAGPAVYAEKDLGWYLFAGYEFRYVARDIFLEGNSYQDSASVDPFPFYSDVQTGAAVQLGPSELAFTYILRSPQYEAQSGWAQFGSVNVRTKF